METNTVQNWAYFQMNGVDAQDYLHRLSTLNFKNVSVLEKIRTDWVPGAILKPTGKFDLYFLLRGQAPAFEILTPYPEGAALETLERMHFLDRFEIKAHAVDGVELPRAPRTDLTRLLCLAPVYPNEINETTNPLELGLEEIIHENKGCYPGQEVIEKIISKGGVPRHLCLIQVKESDLLQGTLADFQADCLAKGLLTSSSLLLPGEKIPKIENAKFHFESDDQSSARLLGMTLLNKTLIKNTSAEGKVFTINGAPATILACA